MGIDLSGRQIRVAEAVPARRADRRSTQSMCRKGVAQLCADERGCSALLNAPTPQSASGRYARRSACRASAGTAHPLRCQTARAGRFASAQSRETTAAAKSAGRRSLLPLPITHTSPDSRSRCFDIKINQLGQTQPGTVHHLQHRAVAHGERIVKVDIQQAVLRRQRRYFLGRWRGAFGVAIPFAGLAFAPRLTSQSKKLRSAESLSAGLAGLSFFTATRRTRGTVAASHCCQLFRPISSAICMMASS